MKKNESSAVVVCSLISNEPPIVKAIHVFSLKGNYKDEKKTQFTNKK